MATPRLLSPRAALWVIALSLAGKGLAGLVLAVFCLTPAGGPRRGAICAEVAPEVGKVQVKLLEAVTALAIHCGLVPGP